MKYLFAINRIEWWMFDCVLSELFVFVFAPKRA